MPSTPEPLTSVLDLVPVVPVVVLDDPATAVPVARALVAGGLPVIELTLRTPVALDALRAIAAEVPDITIGAGTIVEPRQAKEAAAAGAPFLVSPGATPTLLGAMRDTGLPFLPGTATVSEMLTALEAGCTELKFFPAEQSGGAAFLKSISSVAARRPVLPHRRDHPADRPVLPGPAQRRLRRRLLAGTGRRGRRPRLGAGHHAGPCGGRAALRPGGRAAANYHGPLGNCRSPRGVHCGKGTITTGPW